MQIFSGQFPVCPASVLVTLQGSISSPTNFDTTDIDDSTTDTGVQLADAKQTETKVQIASRIKRTIARPAGLCLRNPDLEGMMRRDLMLRNKETRITNFDIL